MKNKMIVSLTAICCFVLTNTFAQETSEGITKDLFETAEATGNVSMLVSAIRAAGIEDDLKDEGPYTIFAPSNDAFAAIPQDVIDGYMRPENQAQVKEILEAHIVKGKVTREDLANETELTAINGQKITVEADSEGLSLNGGATVMVSDIEATNGIIHLIDVVMTPVADNE